MNRKTVTNQTKLRVLFVSHDGGMAGAQRTLLTLLATIDRSRFKPYLLVPNVGKLSHAAKEMGIPVFIRHMMHWVPGINSVSHRQRFSYLVRTLKTLRARSWAITHLIENNKIDLVYTNTVTCIEGALAARMTHTPHIWHIHESILGNTELRPLIPFHFYSIIVNILSNAIIFCSTILAKSYPLPTKKTNIIYNGLPFPPTFNKADAHDAITKYLGINPTQKIVAVVSALQPRKDHFTFLTAAHEVVKENKDVVFLIVGSGANSYTDLIKKKIESLGLASSVKLTGWWSEDKIYDLLAGIDVLVVSSEQESFGLTIIEALAVETPVVSTRCGGPEEVIQEGVTGLLVKVKAPNELAKAVIHLLDNPEFARELGVAGRQDVLSRFSVEHYVAGIQEVIKKVLLHK
jgi:glycosyltransferase involved in cell wall biosynthesis